MLMSEIPYNKHEVIDEVDEEFYGGISDFLKICAIGVPVIFYENRCSRGDIDD